MPGPVRDAGVPTVTRLVALAATAVAVALAVVVGLGGVADGQPSGRAFPPVRPTRVLVLGDSVMKGAATQIAPRLPGREVIVDAEVNRSTGQGADVVAKVGTDWDVVVVLLGHNDGGTPGAYQPAARRILDQLRGVRRVVWLTIHEVRPYYPGVNQYIASLQGTYPNLRTADWNAVANQHPEAVSGDGLHLTGAGATLMADLVGRQVELTELDWYGALRALQPKPTTTTTAAPTTTTAPPTTTSAPSTTRPATTSTSAGRSSTADAGSAGATTAPGAGVKRCLTTPEGVTCESEPDQAGNRIGGPVTVAIVAAWVLVAAWGIRRFRRNRRPDA